MGQTKREPMPSAVRPALPIRFRFAALISGLLIAAIFVFGGAAHWEMRQAAVRAASLRLRTVSDDIARLFEGSAATVRSQLSALANRPLVRLALRAPDGDSANALMRLVERQAAVSQGLQLFDSSGALLRSNGMAARALTPPEIASLISLTSDTAPTATGSLRLLGDSIAYPTVARVAEGERALGYLVHWRRPASSEQSRRQLTSLIGSAARLSLGNARGDLWSDLIKATDAPPGAVETGPDVVHDQPRLEGRHLASAMPVRGAPWILLVEFPYSEILSDLPATLFRLGLFGAVLLMIGVAVAWQMSRSVTRPIAELSEATRAIKSGDLSRRVIVRRRDEVGELADLFNQMAGTIAGGKDEVEQQFGRVKALRAIDLAILGTTDLQLLLKSVLAQIMGQLRCDAAAIFLYNPHTLTVDSSVSIGYRTRDAEREKVRLGDGVAGKAARERRTIAVPDLSKVEMSEGLRQIATSEGIESVYAVPLISKGKVIGVLDALFRRPYTPTDDWLEFCEALAGQAAMAIDSCQSFEELQRSNLELSLAYDTTIEGWSRALDLRDHETEGHSQRVTELTLRLARLAGMSEAELVHVRRGALLHDIGKMGVPDTILLKPGPLDAEEWVVMKKHPTYAYELLQPIDHLRPAIDIPHCHHERWDGKGYPRGLRGSTIPQSARLFAVVDVWDALRSDRPYRGGWSDERVRGYLRDQAGSHFDPEAVDLFFRALAERDHSEWNAAAGRPSERVA